MSNRLVLAPLALFLVSGCAFFMGTPEPTPADPAADPSTEPTADPAPAASCEEGIQKLDAERATLDTATQVDFDGSIFTCETAGVFGSAIKVGQQGMTLTLTAMHEGSEVVLEGTNDGKTLVVTSADSMYGIRMTFSTNAMGLAEGSGEIVRNDGSGCDPTPITCK